MVILDLVEHVTPLAEGRSVRVLVSSPREAAMARTWCELSGNTLLAARDGWLEIRRGRPFHSVASLPPERRPGVRLWMYTNFDCNLSCAYCCVRSSPRAQRRSLGHEAIARLVEEAAACNVREFWLTGGEPFLLADIGDIISTCVARRPTTVLTNGMLFAGRRLHTLASLPRDALTLQISLDSPRPERHDRNRGPGSWQRALAGIRTARELGFRVRVAATVDIGDVQARADAANFAALLDTLGIEAADRLTRPIARRGFATSGLDVAVRTTVPELTVTADGVYWHPVGAADADMLIDREIFPLATRVDRVVELFERHAQRAAAAALVFPCA